jgi:predicted transcriptional regulator
MDVTISQAAKMAGVSRATIYNDIEAGVLSVVTGVKNRKMINVAELERVYKKLNLLEGADEKDPIQTYQNVKASKVSNSDQVAVLQERVESLKRENELLHDLIEKEREDRKREREVVVNFEEYFKNQLENQAENLNVFTKLLEDQRQSKKQRQESWENSMKANKEFRTLKPSLIQK